MSSSSRRNPNLFLATPSPDASPGRAPRASGPPQLPSYPSSPAMTPGPSTVSYASPWFLSPSAAASSIGMQSDSALHTVSTPTVHTGVVPSQATPRRLLVPVMHPFWRHSSTSLPEPSALLPPSSKLSALRSRKIGGLAGLASPSSSGSESAAQPKDLSDCLSKFEVVQNDFQLEGYRIYAVEKWVVERTRYITVLTAHTGDPRDKITVTVFAQAKGAPQSEWDATLYYFKRDGARAKETTRGTIMVTSLEKFRSDFTTVSIPGGNFLDVRQGLYANINLLRMGCSGRSALTLEEPSETTKDRFISTYNLSENCRSRESFCSTVLEVVKVIQAALAMFGLFSLNVMERDGLLCDVTIDGLQKWTQEVGGNFLDLEPMERLGDPVTIASLLSLIIVVRNKLHSLGISQSLVKDPFLDPVRFCRVLYSFLLESSAKLPPRTATFLSDSPHKLAVLAPQYLDLIDGLYDKARSNDSYKVHRVLLSKLDDITTDLRTQTGVSAGAAVGAAGLLGAGLLGSGGGGSGGSTAVNSNMTQATSDLQGFIRAMKGRDGAASVRYLWTGRLEQLKQKRDHVQSDGEGEREKMETKEKVSEEENDWINSMHWSGRIKRVNAWATLGRSKRPSVDLSLRGKPALFEEDKSSLPPPLSAVPSVVLSPDNDEDDVLSSGQVSPVSPNRSLLALGNFSGPSSSNLSAADRKLPEHLKRPPTHRITSWADPLSARDFFKPGDEESDATDDANMGGRRYSLSSVDDGEGQLSTKDDISALGDSRPRISPGRRRSHSFTDARVYRHLRLQTREDLETDVDLCAQVVVMWRRERHLQLVIATLQAFSEAMAASNRALLQDHQAHQSGLDEAKYRAKVISEIAQLHRDTGKLAESASAIQYEAETFDPVDLWHTVRPARQNILNLREKVFGTGRRLPPGSHGAHGRFNRLQWTLDGNERLVDWTGRTESEAEEEEPLVDINPYEEAEPLEDIVENPSMRPTWLLRFFNSWLSRWGAPSSTTKQGSDPPVVRLEDSPPSVFSGSLPSFVVESSRTSSREIHPPMGVLDDDDGSLT